MSLLEQYEQQYAALIAEITGHIGRLTTTRERRELCGKIDSDLAEAQELLEQMSLEIRELNASQRPSFTNKLNCAQVELKRLQTEYRKTRDTALRADTHATIELGVLGENADEFYDDVSIANDQRQRLLGNLIDNSERIERTGNRLTEGYRVALETEHLGAQVLSDLSHQRETLQNSRSRLRETNAELGRASRTVNSMILRALREKVVLYVVGGCFVLAVAVSLYLSFSSSTTSA